MTLTPFLAPKLREQSEPSLEDNEGGPCSPRYKRRINNIISRGRLTFFEEEVPAEGRGHNQPLHISIKCGDYMISRVLIENGSSLNVLPKATLDKLCFVNSQLKTSSVVVRAFDGSKREVMGKITLPICISPTVFDVTFQLLPRRPWIHVVGVVPSSLYQHDGEKELVISTPVPEEYIEEDEEALETSFYRRRNELRSRKPYPIRNRRYDNSGHNQRRILARQRAKPLPERYTSPNHYIRECGESQARLSRGQLG
ncbi:hypothetical protein CR513_25395, partial [Mucuna pruriens]